MKRNLKILTSFWFITGLTILLLNDFIFKGLYGNWLTGKISDFSGLFIFPIFWTALLPGHKNKIFFLTALLFIFWKSPCSQALIDTWNNFELMNINRTVDYTDLFALLILPVSYGFDRGRENIIAIRISPLLPLMISAFSFIATSQSNPNDQQYKPTFQDSPLEYGTEFKIREKKISFQLSKKEFIHLIDFYEITYPFKITNDSMFFAYVWSYDNFDTIAPVIKVAIGSESNNVVLKLQSIIYDTSITNTNSGFKGFKEHYKPENRDLHALRFKSWFIPQFLLIKKIDSLNTAGLSDFENQEYEKSITTFNQAIQISPQWAITKLMFYKSIGDCYLKMQNHTEALKNYYRADSLNQLYSGYAFRPEPYVGLTTVYEQLNRKDSAAKYRKMASEATEWTNKHR
ncbi:MAG TPA: tetratricopeptide repeat protein [Chitinophagales bacterium]|nr:tetratricopeptide repeat protein [Chitinophagales bacterium]